MGIYGRDGKPSLTCQRATPATMAPYRGANRYLRCLFTSTSLMDFSDQKNKKFKTLSPIGDKYSRKITPIEQFRTNFIKKKARIHVTGPK